MHWLVRLTVLFSEGRQALICWVRNRAWEALPMLVTGEDWQQPLSAHKKLCLLMYFWLRPSPRESPKGSGYAGIWEKIVTFSGSILWIKQKEIAINIKQKGIAVTRGVIFPMQDGEKQKLTKQRRTLALCSIPVPSLLAPKSREGPWNWCKETHPRGERVEEQRVFAAWSSRLQNLLTDPRIRLYGSYTSAQEPVVGISRVVHGTPSGLTQVSAQWRRCWATHEIFWKSHSFYNTDVSLFPFQESRNFTYYFWRLFEGKECTYSDLFHMLLLVSSPNLKSD